MKSDKMYQISLMTLGGMLGSILIGLLFFNTSILIPTKSDFQFVSYGFIGALFFSLLKYKSIKEQIFSLLFVLILNLIIFTGSSISLTYVIRDVFFISSIFLSVKLYHHFTTKYSQVKFYLRCFALALIYGVVNSLCGILVYLINGRAGFPPIEFIYLIARYGILIGFGIGLGTDFYFQNKKQLTSWLGVNTVGT